MANSPSVDDASLSVSPLGLVAGGVAGSVIGGIGSYINQKNLNKQAQENWKKNAATSFRYSQMEQRNAAFNAVQGYRSAGLNPAMAQGGVSSPSYTPPAGSAPGSAPVAAPDLASPLLQREAIQRQRAVDGSIVAANNATAHNQEAQAQGHDIDNGRKGVEDKVIQDQWKAYAQTIKDSKEYESLSPQRKAFIDYVQSNDFNAGALTAFNAFADAEIADKKRISDKWAYEFMAKVNELQATHPKVQKTIAYMPIAEREFLLAQTDKLAAEIGRIGVENQLDEHKMDELDAMVTKLKADARATHNNDVYALWDDGESTKAILLTIGRAAEAVAPALVGAAGTAAAGKAIATTKATLDAAKSKKEQSNLYLPEKKTFRHYDFPHDDRWMTK